MGGKSVSEKGKSSSEVSMSDTALAESVRWTGELMDAEWRGRGDREKSARHRLAKNIKVPESYIFRLLYKAEEMTDVRGSVYRALILGRRLYGLACEGIEHEAERIEREAQEIEGRNAAHSGARQTVAGNQTQAQRAP